MALVSSLESTIADHLAGWERAHVDLAIYGTDDPRLIAEAIDQFCRRELGSSARNGLFYQSSVGAVAGVTLADGRRVVIKAHQTDWSAEQLRAVVTLQRHVALTCGLAPDVLAGPSPLGNGLAVVEDFAAALLQKLSVIEPDDVAGLDRLLDEWTVKDALRVLDEIDDRVSVIETIRRIANDPTTDELHTRPAHRVEEGGIPTYAKRGQPSRGLSGRHGGVGRNFRRALLQRLGRRSGTRARRRR